MIELIDNELKKYLFNIKNELIKNFKLNLNINNFDLDNFYKYLKEACDNFISKTISFLLEKIDDEFLKVRNKNEIKITHKKVKKLLIGQNTVFIKRRRYYNKKYKKYFCFIDDFCHIEKWQRMTNNLKDDIALMAGQKSFKKVSLNCDQNISKSTVLNLVKKHSLNYEEENKRKIDTLFIEADEDHIHMQNKTRKIVKLIYVHEGYKNIENSKNKLINPHFFSTLSKKPWKEVKEYIIKNYEYKNIVINGDGAAWIKQGLKFFNNSIFYLDKFHVKKSIDIIVENDINLKKEIYKIINEKDKIAFYEFYNKILLNLDYNTKKADLKIKYLEYLLNNFDYIDFKNSRCSAEGHVSHILSSRMSSRPMAWTEKGAEKMARIRAYIYNHNLQYLYC